MYSQMETGMCLLSFFCRTHILFVDDVMLCCYGTDRVGDCV